jgi:hypothetical protein
MEDRTSGRFGSHRFSRIRRVWLAGRGFLSSPPLSLSLSLSLSVLISLNLSHLSLTRSLISVSLSPSRCLCFRARRTEKRNDEGRRKKKEEENNKKERDVSGYIREKRYYVHNLIVKFFKYPP